MKSYPSIPRSTGQSFQEFDAYIFDKLDGSNLRFEWSKKKSWYKFGTRTRLFDEKDPVFGCAIPIFYNELAEPLAKYAEDSKYENLVVFAEFYGPQSFAGVHVSEDPKSLSVIDIAPYKQGILGPKDFLKVMEKVQVNHAEFLGCQKWTRGFVEKVFNGEISCTFEGVVGKSGQRHNLLMAKAKTSAWINKVRKLYNENEAKKLIES